MHTDLQIIYFTSLALSAVFGGPFLAFADHRRITYWDLVRAGVAATIPVVNSVFALVIAIAAVAHPLSLICGAIKSALGDSPVISRLKTPVFAKDTE